MTVTNFGTRLTNGQSSKPEPVSLAPAFAHGVPAGPRSWWRKWAALAAGLMAALPFMWLSLASFLWRDYSISIIHLHDWLVLLVASAGPYLAMVAIGLANSDKGGSAPLVTTGYLLPLALAIVIVGPIIGLCFVPLIAKDSLRFVITNIGLLFATVAFVGMFYIVILWFLILLALLLGLWTARTICRRAAASREAIIA